MLNFITTVEERERIKRLPLYTAIDQSSTLLGVPLVRLFRLSSLKSPLHKWFVSRGINHVPHMSDIVMSAWWHKLNKRSFNFNAFCVSYWWGR
jgi:hypothetical protein